MDAGFGDSKSMLRPPESCAIPRVEVDDVDTGMSPGGDADERAGPSTPQLCNNP
jgi:hypothetical protein